MEQIFMKLLNLSISASILIGIVILLRLVLWPGCGRAGRCAKGEFRSGIV